MPVTAPAPQEPTPVEIQQWQQGAGNARQQYLQQQARTGYNQTQATNAYNIQNRQADYNFGLRRQTFDDPYIARGIFNSGIRKQGLLNMRTAKDNDFANRQQQYLAQMGGYGLEDRQAFEAQNATLSNLALQEQARRDQLRADLANAIKGIV